MAQYIKKLSGGGTTDKEEQLKLVRLQSGSYDARDLLSSLESHEDEFVGSYRKLKDRDRAFNAYRILKSAVADGSFTLMEDMMYTGHGITDDPYMSNAVHFASKLWRNLSKVDPEDKKESTKTVFNTKDVFGKFFSENRFGGDEPSDKGFIYQTEGIKEGGVYDNVALRASTFKSDLEDFRDNISQKEDMYDWGHFTSKDKFLSKLNSVISTLGELSQKAKWESSDIAKMYNGLSSIGLSSFASYLTPQRIGDSETTTEELDSDTIRRTALRASKPEYSVLTDEELDQLDEYQLNKQREELMKPVYDAQHENEFKSHVEEQKDKSHEYNFFNFLKGYAPYLFDKNSLYTINQLSSEIEQQIRQNKNSLTTYLFKLSDEGTQALKNNNNQQKQDFYTKIGKLRTYVTWKIQNDSNNLFATLLKNNPDEYYINSTLDTNNNGIIKFNIKTGIYTHVHLTSTQASLLHSMIQRAWYKKKGYVLPSSKKGGAIQSFLNSGEIQNKSEEEQLNEFFIQNNLISPDLAKSLEDTKQKAEREKKYKQQYTKDGIIFKTDRSLQNIEGGSEIINTGDSNWDFFTNMNALDWARFSACMTDILSSFSGGPWSVGGGLAATLADGLADAFDPNISTREALTRTGVGIGTSFLSFLPGASLPAKLVKYEKVLKPIKYAINGALAAVGTTAAFLAKDAFAKLFSGDKLTHDDVRALAWGVNLFRGAVVLNLGHLRKNINPNTSKQYTLEFADGSRYPITESQTLLLRNAANKEDREKLIMNIVLPTEGKEIPELLRDFRKQNFKFWRNPETGGFSLRAWNNVSFGSEPVSISSTTTYSPQGHGFVSTWQSRLINGKNAPLPINKQQAYIMAENDPLLLNALNKISRRLKLDALDMYAINKIRKQNKLKLLDRFDVSLKKGAETIYLKDKSSTSGKLLRFDIDDNALYDLDLSKFDFATPDEIKTFLKLLGARDAVLQRTGGKLQILSELRNFPIDNSHTSTELSKKEKGGILKAQDGILIPKYYLDRYLLHELEKWNELQSHNQNAVNLFGQEGKDWRHNERGDLLNAWLTNQAYIADLDAVGADILNYYNNTGGKLNYATPEEFVNYYNNQMQEIRDFWGYKDLYDSTSTGRETHHIVNDTPSNDSVRKHNRLHKALFASRNNADNADKTFNLGYSEPLEATMGSTTWMRRADQYENKFSDVPDEEKKKRIHKIGDFWVYKEYNGDIGLLSDEDRKRLVPDESAAQLTPEALTSSEVASSETDEDKKKEEVGAKSGMSTSGLGTDKNNRKEKFLKVLGGLRNLGPEVFDIARLVNNLRGNRRQYEALLNLRAPLKKPIVAHRNVFTGFNLEQEGLRLAAALLARAGRPQTSDAAINQASMQEAEYKGDNIIRDTLLKSDATFRDTAEKQWAVARERDRYNTSVLDFNNASLTELLNNKYKWLSGLISKNTENWNNWLMGNESRLRQRLDNERDKREDYQELYDQRYIADQIANDEDVKKAKEDYYTAGTLTDTQERQYLKRIKDAEDKAYWKYFNPYYLKKGVITYSKRGGAIDDTLPRKRSKDNDRLVKQIIASLRENSRALENLSRAQLLSIKKMLS